MKHGLRLVDYLDMDWFLEEDRKAGHDALQARDRQWGLEAAKRELPDEKWPLFWIEQRRAGEKSAHPRRCGLPS